MFGSPNEHCWVLIGHAEGDLWYGNMHKMTSGAPCSVAFDADWVMKREEEHGDVVGFIHSHPGMSNHYSDRDDRTMKAWVTSFGKPLACCIVGVNGLTTWWFVDDESPPEQYQTERVGELVFGVTPELYADEITEKVEEISNRHCCGGFSFSFPLAALGAGLALLALTASALVLRSRR